MSATPSVLRGAWRYRFALAAAAALAVLALALAARAGGPERWTASTRLVLDTPVSQIIGEAPKGADSLAWRAEILAALATSEPVRERVAADSRIPLEQLTIDDPALSLPVIAATLPRRAAIVAAADSTPYLLTAQADGALPFVTLAATAPDRDAATRLVESAAAAIERIATAAPNGARVQELVVERTAEIDVERR